MAFNEQAFRANPESMDIRVGISETNGKVLGAAWISGSYEDKPWVAFLHRTECLLDTMEAPTVSKG
jgi:hypothetical protein